MTRTNRKTYQATSRTLLKMMPTPWSVMEFTGRVAHLRSRPVQVIDLDFAAESGVSGAWQPTVKQDFIFVSDGAFGLRRDAIICHEIAHMTLGHTPADLGFAGNDATHDVMSMMLEASPALARKFLFRHDYDSRAEADAEHLATLVISAIVAGPVNGTARHVARSLL